VASRGERVTHSSLMMEAVRTSETSVNNYFTRQYIPEDYRLCGLVVSVEDYKHRGPGLDSRALLRIFVRELGLERGSLSLVIG
jgi:hypothetical protein